MLNDPYNEKFSKKITSKCHGHVQIAESDEIVLSVRTLNDAITRFALFKELITDENREPLRKKLSELIDRASYENQVKREIKKEKTKLIKTTFQRNLGKRLSTK